MRLSLCTTSFACVLASAGCGGEGLVAISPTTNPDMLSTTTSALCGSSPHTIAMVPGSPNQLLLAGTSLYWTTWDGPGVASSWRSTTDRDGAERFARADNLIGVDGENVIWSSVQAGRLNAANLATGTTTDLGQSLSDYWGSYGSLRPIVAHGQIAWSAGKIGGGAFYSMPVGGGAPTQHHLANRWVVPFDWAGLSDGMLWTSTEGVWKSNAAGEETLVGQPATAILRVADAVAYVDGPSGVVAIPLGAGHTTRIVAAPFDAPWERSLCKGELGKNGISQVVVSADESVYATTWQDCMDGSFSHAVWSVGAAPRKLTEYSDGFATAALAANDQCVYWLATDTSNGIVSLSSLASPTAKK